MIRKESGRPLPPVSGRSGTGKVSQQQQLGLKDPWPTGYILEPRCPRVHYWRHVVRVQYCDCRSVSGGARSWRWNRSPDSVLQRPEEHPWGDARCLFVYRCHARTRDGRWPYKSWWNKSSTNKLLAGWTLCADSYCNVVIKHGPLPAAVSTPIVGHWHTVALEVTDNIASGSIDSSSVFTGFSVMPSPPPPPRPPPPPPGPIVQQYIGSTTLLATGKEIAAGDYHQIALPPPKNGTQR